MGSSNLRQFGLLVWKNWLLQKHDWIQATFQVILPVLFASLLLLMRIAIKPVPVLEPTIWNSFDANTVLPPNLVFPPQPGSPLMDRHWRVAFAPNISVVQKLVSAATKRLDSAYRTPNSANFSHNGVAVGQGERTKPRFSLIFVRDFDCITWI
jgi:hypothetical protein